MIRSNSWVSDASPALTSAIVRRDRSMFLQASTCRVLMTIASLSGLIFATIDYEINYSPDRTHDNCKKGGHAETLRWMNVAVTIVAAVFTSLGHMTANEAQRHTLLSLRKRDQLFYFFIPRGRIGLSLLLDLAILSVFPYPYVEGDLRITEHEHTPEVDRWTDVCYTASEILYLCSFGRLYFLGRNVLYIVGYVDSHSRSICKENGVGSGVSFTLRSFIRLNPVIMVCIFIVPTALVLGVFLRVFERPYMDISNLDYEPYYNSFWLALMTITTVNYADYYPTTHLGRLVALICGLWGFFLVSMMVYIIDRNLSLNSKEEQTLFRIKRTRAAAQLVIAALWLNHAKLNPGVADVDSLRESLGTAAARHRVDRLAIKSSKAESADPTRPLRAKLRRITESLARLEAMLQSTAK